MKFGSTSGVSIRWICREGYGDEVNPRVLVLLTDEMSAVLVRGQLGSLIESGCSVAVGTRRTSANSFFDDGTEVHHIDFVRQPSPIADVRALAQTVRLIRKIGPDVVHTSTPKAGLLGTIAAWLCRVPVRVYQVRGLRYETETGGRRRLYRLFERISMRLATHVLFNSASLRTLAESDRLIEPGRGVVLGSGNGVDTQRFTPVANEDRQRARHGFGIPENATVIGFVGRLTHDKGIADLMSAFDELTAENVWLLLVGTFEAGDPVDSHVVTAINSHPRIVHREWVDDTRDVYAAIDVLAFPSFREGLPNVPLEAQACGVPVIGYAATGTVDAVVDGETGVLVSIGDRSALADSLATVLDDADLRENLGQQGREFVSTNFQPEAVWARIAEMYRSALDR